MWPRVRRVITFVCSSCNAFRYRATREAPPGGRLTDADLVPVEGQTTPFSSATRPTCDTCGSPLRAAAERSSSSPNGGAPAPPSAPSRSGSVAPAVSGGAVSQLFCVEPDEEITQIKEMPGGDRYLVITTRRLVMIHTAEVPV